ncbi:MAG TPA: helix-turn-helix domain-containing protein [Candidatus Dormibacteraeota bacterium]|nr:helix-turn-helix domain-containing protein [Candidatus Dormibacteraeota bacterium]
MTSTEPVLLDFRRAGEFLGVSHWVVRNLVWNGQLSFVRLGRKHLLDRRDLVEWVEKAKERNKN